MRILLILLILLKFGYSCDSKSDNIEVDVSKPLTKEYCMELWENFKVTFQKTYKSPEEEEFRKYVMIKKVFLIFEHNRRFINNEEPFAIRLHSHCDLTFEEIINLKTGLKPGAVIKSDMSLLNTRADIPTHLDQSDYYYDGSNEKPIIQLNTKYECNNETSETKSHTLSQNSKPKIDRTGKSIIVWRTNDSTIRNLGDFKKTAAAALITSNLTTSITYPKINWTALGHVSPVKDQKECSSCWAFVATSAVESQYSIKYNATIDLSEQYLVDCDILNFGCTGGNPYSSLYWMSFNGGVQQSDYPYKATKSVCKYQNNMKLFPSYGFDYNNYFLNGDENLLKDLLKQGPVAVAIEVTELFTMYSKGIFYDPACSGNLNHALLLTGYGTENNIDYWVAKNSWGTSFGEYGYIKIVRNKKSHCGIAQFGAVPFV